MRTIASVVVLLAVWTLVGHGQTSLGQESIDDLTRQIRDVLAETGAPGMIGAIVTRDRVVWAGGVGLANRATGAPADADTVFRLGSISKSLTTLAILILAERGELSLDDEVRTLLPDSTIVNPWAETDPIRVAHLLEHTAGLDEVYRGVRRPDAGPLPLQDTLRLNARSLVVRWPPGTRASYSNMGPAVAASILETITGRTYEDFVAEELCEPLGMRSATFFLHEGVAPGYRPGGQQEVDRVLMAPRPAGGLNASANDMARFLRFMLNRGALDGRQLLEPSSIQRMETPTTGWAAMRGIRMGYGPGLHSQYVGGFQTKFHPGVIPGVLSGFRYLPAHGVGYFIAVNSFDAVSGARLERLFFDAVTVGLEPDAPAPVVPLSDEEIRSYGGYYEPDTTRFGLWRFADVIVGLRHVTATRDRMEVGSPGLPGIENRPLGQGLFGRASDPAPVVMFRRDNDDLFLVTPDGTYQKIPAWSAWGRWALTITVLTLMLSAPAFAVVWIPRRLANALSREDVAPRWLPLGAVLSLLGAAAIFAWIVGTGLFLLQTLNPWAVMITALTWLFAVLTVLGAWRVWTTRSGAARRSVWVHGVLVCLANVTALAYLAYWDIIGFRLWP